MNNLIGKKIDHYEIQALLGEGGMGSVYRAYDLNLQRPVALKVMLAQLASQQEFQARFMQEARSAARLTHPSIVVANELQDLLVIQHLVDSSANRGQVLFQPDRAWLSLLIV
ncbi:MAG TPA: protein kinase [Anaerolineales bacterium]|nr:protein kinase [Anaerolineales bacterium]